jgi:hypothetical protein
MKLKIVREEMPVSVIRRFPHLETELHEMAMKDEGFSQLCLDYKDVIGALKQMSAGESETKMDLLGLKTNLEVEILEHMLRSDTQRRNQA